jgi:hypothetical protein
MLKLCADEGALTTLASLRRAPALDFQTLFYSQAGIVQDGKAALHHFLHSKGGQYG